MTDKKYESEEMNKCSVNVKKLIKKGMRKVTTKLLYTMKTIIGEIKKKTAIKNRKNLQEI